MHRRILLTLKPCTPGRVWSYFYVDGRLPRGAAPCSPGEAQAASESNKKPQNVRDRRGQSRRDPKHRERRQQRHPPGLVCTGNDSEAVHRLVLNPYGQEEGNHHKRPGSGFRVYRA